MTDYSGAPKVRFRFGDALQAAFDACFSNFGPFALVALVVYALPTFLITLILPPTAFQNSSTFLVGALCRGAVGLAAGGIFQGALTRGVLTHLGGGKPGFAEMVRSGLTSAAPLVGLSIVAGIAIGLGLVFFIAPGLFLLSLWGIAAPAVVIERKGIFGALARSAHLTRRHRWAVLGAFILFVVILYLALLAGGVIIGFIGGFGAVMGGVRTGVQMGPTFLLTQAIGAVFGSIGAIFFNALPPALYFELRRAKEGSTPAELASVFD